MPRIRTIKPEFPQSESMGRVSRDARLTFIQMWTLADDSGRLRGNSRMLASLLFPYDDDAPSLVEAWMGELERESCIIRYASDDGTSYVQICKWKDHQKIDKPSVSRLPAPDSAKARECSRNVDEASRKKALDLGPRTKDQGEGGRGEEEPLSIPPTVAEVKAEVAKKNYRTIHPEAWWAYWDSIGWRTKNGVLIKWQSRLMSDELAPEPEWKTKAKNAAKNQTTYEEL